MDTNSTEDLKFIFDFLDKDKSGGLDQDELQCGLSILKVNLAGVQIRNIMKVADLNDDGKVDFSEFVKLCLVGATKDKLKIDDMVSRLHPYDREGDGKIDVIDLKTLLAGEGEPLEEEDINEIIRELEVTSDGKIDIRSMLLKFFS